MFLNILLVLVVAHLLYFFYRTAKRNRAVNIEALGDGPDLEKADKALGKTIYRCTANKGKRPTKKNSLVLWRYGKG